MQSIIFKKTAGWSILIILAIALTSCKPGPAGPQIEWQAPEFEITAVDGESFHYPQSLQGSTIILFWASWCPYCKSLMPHLQSIIDEYGGKIRVVALNFRDDEDPAGYIEERGYDFHLILNSEDAAASWGVKGTPGLFLADPTGRVVFSRGAIPEQAYGTIPGEGYDKLKNYQKAARMAPIWAARLRLAIDRLLQE